jgi:GR25 family glycosyltransferase involved in LPS biosynthesis
MNFREIPKFIINLEKRTDRLSKVEKEMSYIGWEYELFKGVDENSYVGCSKSHLGVIEIAKERGYPMVMVLEDDIRFMPYAKTLLEKIEHQCKNLAFGIFNLAPTLDRPINVSQQYDLLLDMTNLPEKKDYHRDIYGGNMVIYHESIYDIMLGIKEHPSPFYYPIDEYAFRFVIQEYQSYCPILPIAPQANDYSNIENSDRSTFYLQTYNWNGYSPCKIPKEFMDEMRNQKIKEDNTHLEFYYES